MGVEGQCRVIYPGMHAWEVVADVDVLDASLVPPPSPLTCFLFLSLPFSVFWAVWGVVEGGEAVGAALLVVDVGCEVAAPGLVVVGELLPAAHS